MAHVYPTSWRIEFELAGVGGGWTNVSADVMGPVRLEYGIAGNGPLDRVADVGRCEFGLRNSTRNSAGLVGYYSPLHANCRSGFTHGIGMRLSIVYGGVTYYKFRGRLKEIDPEPGARAGRSTRVLAVDWMEEAAESEIRDVTLLSGVRSDEVVSAILAAIGTQPAATEIQQGQDTYTFALDDLGGEHPPAVSLLQDVCQSELGFAGVKGDQVQGGTFFFEDRHARVANNTNAVTLDNTMRALVVPKTLGPIRNQVHTVIAPRRVDAAATTVLYAIQTPTTAAISAGASVTIFGDYRDPDQLASFVGGKEMVTPVATTDYTMNTAADGSGSDLTASFSVTATFFASTVKLVVTNNHASLSGYLTKLQVRGKGIYRYAPVTYRGANTTSQAAHGVRPTTVPMPYQDSAAVAQGAADYLANLYGSLSHFVDEVSFNANRSAALLTAALDLEISDRIGIEETVTGVTSVLPGGSRGWYIQSVGLDLRPGRGGLLVDCRWGLAPASASGVWILDTSALDVDTVLAYV